MAPYSLLPGNVKRTKANKQWWQPCNPGFLSSLSQGKSCLPVPLQHRWVPAPVWDSAGGRDPARMTLSLCSLLQFCSGPAVHWYAEECSIIHIRITVLFLVSFPSQRAKRSSRIALWREHARQMCCLGHWECGFSQLSCGHLLFRAQACQALVLSQISDSGGAGVKGSQENEQGFNAESFLFIWKAWITSS